MGLSAASTAQASAEESAIAPLRRVPSTNRATDGEPGSEAEGRAAGTLHERRGGSTAQCNGIPDGGHRAVTRRKKCGRHKRTR
jgi:hypothetical protein